MLLPSTLKAVASLEHLVRLNGETIVLCRREGHAGVRKLIREDAVSVKTSWGLAARAGARRSAEGRTRPELARRRRVHVDSSIRRLCAGGANEIALREAPRTAALLQIVVEVATRRRLRQL